MSVAACMRAANHMLRWMTANPGEKSYTVKPCTFIASVPFCWFLPAPLLRSRLQNLFRFPARFTRRAYGRWLTASGFYALLRARWRTSLRLTTSRRRCWREHSGNGRQRIPDSTGTVGRRRQREVYRRDEGRGLHDYDDLDRPYGVWGFSRKVCSTERRR